MAVTQVSGNAESRIPNGQHRIRANRIAMARRLEVPVFRSMMQQRLRKLGKPAMEDFTGEPWKVL